jgi:prepilin-type N-terminal cleavage/methylation domain-containing protein
MRKGLARRGGFTLIEALIVIVVVGILAAIAIPAYLMQRDRAKEAVLKHNTRYVRIDAATYVSQELDKTYRATDNHSAQEAANAAKYVSNALEVGIENGLPRNNTMGYVNPYSGKKAIVNAAALSTAANEAPPAVWITNSATYRYATFPTSGTNLTNARTYLKGTVLAVWNTSTTPAKIEIFSVDRNGKKSPTVTTVTMP